MQVELGDLCWGPPPSPADNGVEGPQSVLLRGSWDGEMYREQQAHVEGTMHEDTRVLTMHLYSDATVLSSSGAVSAYPLRMRVVNINTKDVRWVTLAYIPQVESKFIKTRKDHEVRSELLQRILHLVFRGSVLASHRGAWLNLPGGGRVRVSPRALLYVCDQPEERAVMCLKGTGCLFPCTPCMVGREDSCSASGADAPSRRPGDGTGAAQERHDGDLLGRGGEACRGRVGAQPQQRGPCDGRVGWPWKWSPHAVPIARFRSPSRTSLCSSRVELLAPCIWWAGERPCWAPLYRYAASVLFSIRSVSHCARPETWRE